MAFSDGIADFRSDTVTRPTAEMLRAMATAPVGDDVYGDDPTVNALEEESAAAVGMESAVFVPTGTMGNQLAIMYHTSPGEEILAHEGSHSRSIEAGAPQALSGVAFRTVRSADGSILKGDIEAALEMQGYYPRIGLLLWENAHNTSGGRVVPIEVMEEVTAIARENEIPVHLDGARLFNAVVASGVPASRYAAAADTLQFCFSKGLGAPVGSIICGAADAIAEIRYLRKRLGGGMRQSGVIAAAARVALADRERLVEDHVLARRLATLLAERFPGSIEVASVETNMLRVNVPALGRTWVEIESRLELSGVVASPPRAGVWRLVTHRDVDGDDVDRLVAALA